MSVPLPPGLKLVLTFWLGLTRMSFTLILIFMCGMHMKGAGFSRQSQ